MYEDKGFWSRKFIFSLICQVAVIVLASLSLIDGSEFVTATLGLAGIYVAGNAASKLAAPRTNGN